MEETVLNLSENRAQFEAVVDVGRIVDGLENTVRLEFLEPDILEYLIDYSAEIEYTNETGMKVRDDLTVWETGFLNIEKNDLCCRQSDNDPDVFVFTVNSFAASVNLAVRGRKPAKELFYWLKTNLRKNKK